MFYFLIWQVPLILINLRVSLWGLDHLVTHFFTVLSSMRTLWDRSGCAHLVSNVRPSAFSSRHLTNSVHRSFSMGRFIHLSSLLKSSTWYSKLISVKLFIGHHSNDFCKFNVKISETSSCITISDSRCSFSHLRFFFWDFLYYRPSTVTHW